MRFSWALAMHWSRIETCLACSCGIYRTEQWISRVLTRTCRNMSENVVLGPYRHMSILIEFLSDTPDVTVQQRTYQRTILSVLMKLFFAGVFPSTGVLRRRRVPPVMMETLELASSNTLLTRKVKRISSSLQMGALALSFLRFCIIVFAGFTIYLSAPNSSGVSKFLPHMAEKPIHRAVYI